MQLSKVPLGLQKTRNATAIAVIGYKVPCYSYWLITWLTFLFVGLSCKAAKAQATINPPNIVVILADDLGWTDLQCYGSTFYETPNLNKLAKQGVRFTSSYASAPVCSPTRASILTGRYPIKTGITDWIKGRQWGGKAAPFEKMIAQPFQLYLPAYSESMATLATQKKYSTAFIGKWHLGEEEKNWPEAYGFQVNKGGFKSGSPTGFKNDSTGGYFTPYANPRLTDGPKGEYLTNRLTDEAITFIQSNKNNPFLLFFSLYAVHNPLQAPAELVKKYEAKKRALDIGDSIRFSAAEPWMKFEKKWRNRLIQDNPTYAAMIENMDGNIGRLLQTLDSLELTENTLVIFTSDNGGLSTAEGSPTANAPLRGGKGWLYEGGIRVPLIVKWPGKLPQGNVSTIPVSTVDILPTVYNALTNTPLTNSDVDGTDLLVILANEKLSKQRRIFWHYPHYSNQGGKPSAAILKNNYKLIINFENDSIELYNLANDIGEKNNLVARKPSIAKAYELELRQWLTANNAKFPIPNPKYQANYSQTSALNPIE